MKLFANPTSPFVRIARMALIEKHLDAQVDLVIVDAWADAPDFLDANPAGRVPALVTDDDVKLTEASLILRHLDALEPEPALLPHGPDAAAVLARAGLAYGVIEAAVSVIIGRKSAPGFDRDMVGTKRFRTMHDGLACIDRTQPPDHDRPFDLADITTVTALDYLVFRFGDTDWRAHAPRLAAFRDAQAQRPSVAQTQPKA